MLVFISVEMNDVSIQRRECRFILTCIKVS